MNIEKIKSFINKLNENPDYRFNFETHQSILLISLEFKSDSPIEPETLFDTGWNKMIKFLYENKFEEVRECFDFSEEPFNMIRSFIKAF